MFFASDNGAPAAPEVMAALAAANEGPMPAYGNDDWTVRVGSRLNDLFEREVTTLLVTTGTAANCVALAALCPPWGAVLGHTDAHVHKDEGGAPEFYTHGAKLVGIEGQHGKITGAALKRTVETSFARPPHSVRPHVVTITQASESGTVYTPDEVADVAAAARTSGLALHMDGARFANAVAALGCSPAEITWKAGVDALSFGFTKNGAICAEAVIFFDAAAASTLEARRKRGGHLWSKARYLAAQIEPMLQDGLWLRLAGRANAAAARLAAGLRRLDIELASPVEANEVFARLSPSQIDALQRAGAIFYVWSGGAGEAAEGPMTARFVCAYSTTDAEVDALLAVCDAVQTT